MEIRENIFKLIAVITLVITTSCTSATSVTDDDKEQPGPTKVDLSVVDKFTQNDVTDDENANTAKLDLVVVVDDSVSMGAELPALVLGTQAFVDALDTALGGPGKHDTHVGVVTSNTFMSKEAGNTCGEVNLNPTPGEIARENWCLDPTNPAYPANCLRILNWCEQGTRGALVGEHDPLLAGQSVFDAQDPQFANLLTIAFARNIHGHWLESVFMATRMFMEKYPVGHELNRSGAHRSFLLVTDANDASNNTYDNGTCLNQQPELPGSECHGNDDSRDPVPDMTNIENYAYYQNPENQFLTDILASKPDPSLLSMSAIVSFAREDCETGETEDFRFNALLPNLNAAGVAGIRRNICAVDAQTGTLDFEPIMTEIANNISGNLSKQFQVPAESLDEIVTDSVKVFKNDVELVEGVDYTYDSETGSGLLTDEPELGDSILVQWFKPGLTFPLSKLPVPSSVKVYDTSVSPEVLIGAGLYQYSDTLNAVVFNSPELAPEALQKFEIRYQERLSEE